MGGTPQAACPLPLHNNINGTLQMDSRAQHTTIPCPTLYSTGREVAAVGAMVSRETTFHSAPQNYTPPPLSTLETQRTGLKAESAYCGGIQSIRADYCSQNTQMTPSAPPPPHA